MRHRRRPPRVVLAAAGVVAVVALAAALGTTTVPDVVGDDTRTATDRLAAAGLSRPHVAGIGDTVVGVTPEAGSRVLRFSGVELVLGTSTDG